MDFEITQGYIEKSKKYKVGYGVALSLSMILMSAFIVINSKVDDLVIMIVVTNFLFFSFLWFLLYRIIKINWGKLTIDNTSFTFKSIYGESIIGFDSIKRIEITQKDNEIILINLVTPKIHPGFKNLKGFDDMGKLAENIKEYFSDELIKEKKK